MKQEVNYLLSDPAIIELYWARDEAAIKHTDLKYRNYLLKTAYNVLEDMQDCEECLNDTYVETWNSIPPQRPRVLQAFLGSIMRNQAIDRFRQRHRKKASRHAFFPRLRILRGMRSRMGRTMPIPKLSSWQASSARGYAPLMRVVAMYS